MSGAVVLDSPDIYTALVSDAETQRIPVNGHPAPFTRPSWSAGVVVLGALIALTGVTAWDWVNDQPLLGVASLHAEAMREGRLPSHWGRDLLQAYLDWLALGLVLLPVAYSLAWTAGGVRGRKSAMLILNTSGKKVAAGRLGSANALLAASCALAVLAHALMLRRLFGSDLSQLLVGLQVGGWTMLAGLLVVTIGCAVGPRGPAPVGGRQDPTGSPGGGLSAASPPRS